MKFMQKLKKVNQNFDETNNIQKFGEYIPALDSDEKEARINIMVNYNSRKNNYRIALFPKRTNRPKIYYDDKNQMKIGLAIKESLGNLITFRQEDFERLSQSPGLITKVYNDTSITKKQSDNLSAMIMNL